MLKAALSRIASAAVLLILPLHAGSMMPSKPEDVGLSADRSEASHRSGAALHRFAGCGWCAVTLVARRGKIAYFEAQGMADLEAKRPMAKDSIFRLASMSKPITGIAVMMLVEEGKVRLSDPVSRFLPEFKQLNKVAVPKPNAPPGRWRRPRSRGGPGANEPVAFDVVSASREITIRDLLTHGSGLGQRRAWRVDGANADSDGHSCDLYSEAGFGASRFSAGNIVAV